MQKIRIKISAYESKLIDNAVKQIVDTVLRSGAKVAGPVPLPTERTVWAIHKSPFKYGNAKEHYQLLVHKRLIEILDPNPKTIDALTHLQLAAGVSIEIK
jgi:small subunit ribosomal protein S10